MQYKRWQIMARTANNLMKLEFIGLCLITFLASCNLTVYYNLFNYLQSLGIPVEQRGMVIGVYSLTAMTLYLLASPFLHPGNAAKIMLFGMLLLIASGFGYFFTGAFWGLMAMRILNGAGQFCIGAGAMTLLVHVIPREHSGQAFSIYSVAFLVSYGCVPALMDNISRLTPSTPHGYAAMSLLMIPSALLILFINRRHPDESGPVPVRNIASAFSNLDKSIRHAPVAILLFFNTCYFYNWSSLFYLFKEYAQLNHIPNVGLFFSVQTCLMIVFRLMAGRLFDQVNKQILVGGAFLTIALGHLALDNVTSTWGVVLVGILFGLGTGIGYPSIYGLMYQISTPDSRHMNANLMNFAVQAGFFFGPVIGSALVASHGYHGYFMASIILSIGVVITNIAMARRIYPGNGISTTQSQY